MKKITEDTNANMKWLNKGDGYGLESHDNSSLIKDLVKLSNALVDEVKEVKELKEKLKNS